MASKKEIKINVDEPEDTKQDSRPEAAADAVDSTDPSEATETVVPAEETVEQAEPLSEEDQLRLRVAELEDRLLRSQAEFENFRKRTARQYESLARSANETLLLQVLDVIDNFERAFDHANDDATIKGLQEGMELIHNQLRDLLKRHNVVSIDAVGKVFDPNLHEALMQIASDEFDEGVVAGEVSKGYRIGDRVLRFSKVSVSKGKADDGEKN
jgi:molecular chaperone GrpE